MGRDDKRRRKVLKKGAKSLAARSREHVAKAPDMRSPEGRDYAMKEARLYLKASRQKLEKTKQITKKRRRRK